ncbi:hypothetical protein NSK11_contig00062-0033 [Nocardia seriolae]|nr:hypothetical protein NS07_v2contig00059-0005 [Nocardia seriolae]GAP29725.1 hypothetical protein NSK11_contig00062-0033 [Nocardia seriolae]
MYWYDHDMGGWGFAWMGVGMLLFWGLLIAGLVIAVRFAVSDRGPAVGGGPAVRPPGAEELLKERFARGEIDEQEYNSRLATLRGR